MSLKTLTRANFRFLDNLPISQFILNFLRPHKTKNITDTIVYDSYVRKKQRAGFMGWRGEGRGNRCIVLCTADVACLPLATPNPFPSHILSSAKFFFFFKFCNQDVSSMTPSLQMKPCTELSTVLSTLRRVCKDGQLVCWKLQISEGLRNNP